MLSLPFSRDTSFATCVGELQSSVVHSSNGSVRH